MLVHSPAPRLAIAPTRMSALGDLARIERDTLVALAAPRRAFPIALVVASVLSSEWIASRSLIAVGLDALLLVTFTATAPAMWRAGFARPLRTPLAHLAAWTVFTLTALALVIFETVLVPPFLGFRHTFVSEPRSLSVLIVLYLVGGWGLGRDIELEASVERERARAERLAIDAEHAQILALRAQLDPHFLFNTLNAIAEWCREDPRVAERATLDLASLLRSIFDALQTPEWPLTRELAILHRLAALYAARDASRYRFGGSVDDAATARAVPPLILLPIFENAIKHGPSAGHDGVVSLRVRLDGDCAEVTITNPGAFGPRRDGGAGLASVERRLALAYGDAVQPTITSTRDTTTVTVSLPRKSTTREPT